MMRWLLLPCGLAVSVGLLLIGFSRAGDDKTWNTVATKAIDFLKSTQQESGGWSTDKSPGVTGVPSPAS